MGKEQKPPPAMVRESAAMRHQIYSQTSCFTRCRHRFLGTLSIVCGASKPLTHAAVMRARSAVMATEAISAIAALSARARWGGPRYGVSRSMHGQAIAIRITALFDQSGI